MRTGRLPVSSAPPGLSASKVALVGLVWLAGALLAGRLWLWGSDWPAIDPEPGRDLLADADADNQTYRRGVWVGAFVQAAVGPGALVWCAVQHRRWVPPLAGRVGRRPWLIGAIIGAAAATVMALAAMPVGMARHIWGRSHGVIVQGVADWFGDHVVMGAIQAVVLGAVGAGLGILMARRARTWWIGLAAGGAIATVVMVWLAPVAIAPLFRSTAPLDDAPLRADVEQLAQRAQIGSVRVLVSDAASRTTAANAHVSGLGSSRQVVLYDTLVERFPADQVRVVVAHEMAHVARHHVLKGTLWAVLLAGPLGLLLYAGVRWTTGSHAIAAADEPATLLARRLAVVATAAALIAAISSPLQSAISRSYEREADDLALRWSGDPAAAIELQRGLVVSSRNLSRAPVVVRLWFGTHPSPAERIGRAIDAGGRP